MYQYFFPILPNFISQKINNGCDGEWYEYIPPFPYTPITDNHKEIRGSCSTFYQRIDVTDEITGLPEEERGLEKINERFVDSQLAHTCTLPSQTNHSQSLSLSIIIIIVNFVFY